MTMQTAVVLVDVDGTLVEGQSYASLLQELWHQKWRWWRLIGILCRRLPHQLLRKLRLVDRMGNQDRWARSMAWLLAGASAAEVNALMGAAAERLKPRLRAGLASELAEHQRAGRHICLASTVIEPWLARLAPLVQADAWAGTGLVIQNGRYTGALNGSVCNGVRKLEHVERAVCRHGERIDWDESYAYSDGLPDLPMLERVGHPVVVDPDSGLAAIARARSWRVL